jgi:hypothetical protein
VVWFFNDDERLAPEADLLVLMRNRQYLPRLGRFLQPDPNATGVAVQPSLAYGGSALPTPDPYVDLHSWAADGTSALAYALSDPVNGADPTGLFFSIGDVLGASSWQSDLQQDAMDEYSDVHSTIRDYLESHYDGVALDRLTDIHWASNWSEPDDFYIGSAQHTTGQGTWGRFWGLDDQSTASFGGHSAFASSSFGKRSRVRLPNAGVYAVYDDVGDLIYIGRSSDVDRRREESRKERNGASSKVLYRNMTYDQMRGMEQREIEKARNSKKHKKKLKNGINGVRPGSYDSPFYDAAATEFLRKRKRFR